MDVLGEIVTPKYFQNIFNHVSLYKRCDKVRGPNYRLYKFIKDYTTIFDQVAKLIFSNKCLVNLSQVALSNCIYSGKVGKSIVTQFKA